jgi:signal transduction histidine kinase
VLSEFLTKHRAEIIDRYNAIAAARHTQPNDAPGGTAVFLDQLLDILQSGQTDTAAIIPTAANCGAELLLRGLSIGDVVYSYGDLCQTITTLAIERGAQIPTEDFLLLNRCLDTAIASAVTEYGRRRDLEVAVDAQERAADDMGILLYEAGNCVWSATLAFDALKTGSVGVFGNTGAVVARSLASLRKLIERSFAVMKLKGQRATQEPVSVRQLFEVVQRTMEAEGIAANRRLSLEVGSADATFQAEFRVLTTMVEQLIRNAHNHTPAGGRLILRGSATANLVRIEIEDECGGLRGTNSTMFGVSGIDGREGSGLHLTLGLIRRGIQGIGGAFSVHDLPGKGCVFIIQLPRATTSASQP